MYTGSLIFSNKQKKKKNHLTITVLSCQLLNLIRPFPLKDGDTDGSYLRLPQTRVDKDETVCKSPTGYKRPEPNLSIVGVLLDVGKERE